MNTSALDAPNNRRKKGGRQVARPNRPWTQTELASRPAYNAAGVMLTRADMKELGSTDNNSDDGGYDAKRDAAESYDVAIAEMRRRKEWREKLTAAKRIEFIGNCMMIEGDCLTIMPQIGKVDAVVTDPPWNMAFFQDDNKTWSEYAEWLVRLNQQYLEIAPDAAVVFLSSKAIPFVSHVFQGWQPFAACKNFSQMSASKDVIPNAFDIGFARIQGVFTGSGRNWFVCNTAGMLKDRTGHPTPRTLDAMITVLGWLYAKTILDPFMGSGTTGVACVKTGRHFIGIELDPDYFEIACRRVREAYAQPDLLIDAPKAAPQVQEAFEL